MTTKSIPLAKFLGSIRQKDYSSIKVYCQDSNVRFIQLFSPLRRVPFLLQVPSALNIYTRETDHLIKMVDNDYRNLRQREYLNKIQLKTVACLSTMNICIKNDQIYQCYLIDNIPNVSLSDSDSNSDLDPLESDTDDVEIDDYPVTNIIPVFNLIEFIKGIEDFEQRVLLPNYQEINDAEERNNEEQVEQLLAAFDKQKELIKERIFQLHKENYHIHRDIDKTGQNLQKVYLIKKKAEHEKDRVRFKIERLCLETEEAIDNLNQRLGEQRNKASILLNKYWEYIGSFGKIDIDE